MTSSGNSISLLNLRFLTGSLLFLMLFGLFCLAAANPDYLYIWIGPVYIPQLHPFLDLHCMLAHSDGYAMGWDVKRMASNPLDVIGRGYPAVSVWWFQIFTFLGWGRIDLIWLGSLTVFIFMGVLARLFATERILEFCITVGIAFSPASVMAMERCNVDVIIFILLAALPWLAARHLYLGFTVLTGFLIGLKYYPVMALGALLGKGENIRAKWIIIASIMLFICFYLIFYWGDLVSTARSVSTPFTFYTFGFKPIFQLFDFSSSWIAIIRGISILIGGLLVLYLGFVTDPGSLPTVRSGSAESYLMGTGITIFSFFAINSFEYRLIFFFFAVPLLLQWLRHPGRLHQILSAVSLILLLVLLYMEHIWLLWNTDFTTMEIAIPDNRLIPKLKHALYHVFIWLQLGIYGIVASGGIKTLLLHPLTRKRKAS